MVPYCGVCAPQTTVCCAAVPSPKVVSLVLTVPLITVAAPAVA